MATPLQKAFEQIDSMFPINRRHQRMATYSYDEFVALGGLEFPINRRHQRMATPLKLSLGKSTGRVSNQ